MKQLLRTLLFFVAAIYSGSLIFSQTVIDYQNWTPPSPLPCNLFGTAIGVDATINGSTSTIAHLTNIGQPTYNGSDKAVNLNCSYSTGAIYKGTQFQITNNFRVGYQYVIKMNARIINSSNTGGNASIVINLNNGGNGGNNTCTGVQTISSSTSGGLINSQVINSSSFTDYTINYNTLSAEYLNMTVGAVSPSSSSDNSQTVLIRKITITQVLPPLTFTLSPSPVNKICGTALNQTFTVSSNIPPSATVSYLWNLGSTGNGWLYNGSAANATITTTTNTLALTAADCGTTPNNITVTATVNGTNYNAGTITVNNVLPTFTIDGAPNFCSGSQSYSVVNVPCTATISWGATPMGITTPPTSGNPTSLSQIGNGAITLSATITNACGVNSIIVPKNISVGGAVKPGPISFPLIDQVTGRIQASIDDVPGATSYKWYKNGVLVATYTGTFAQIPISKTQCNVAYDISVSAVNSCGASAQTHANAYVPCSGLRATPVFTIAPNPAKSTITVTPNPTTVTSTNTIARVAPNSMAVGSVTTTNIINEIRIYNMQGILKKTIKPGKKTTFVINIGELTNGIYLMDILTGNTKETQQLLIQR